MEVFVFRTNAAKREQIQMVASHLNSIRGVHKWNFDLEDHENILRIEAIGISPGRVIETLSDANYFCEELPD